ncbi:DgyrCDS12198 [Dimorphilus gyrociliatus]|uniref:DgyrCDS12198 n=1 Tax=Dimorphilus gyrociliatus TaxID=2664684 RepID=A0A7I8W8I0_9ANNE|nr:DgyrCDS12198 [Dimorphilus gyrociliatus]
MKYQKSYYDSGELVDDMEERRLKLVSYVNVDLDMIQKAISYTVKTRMSAQWPSVSEYLINDSTFSIKSDFKPGVELKLTVVDGRILIHIIGLNIQLKPLKMDKIGVSNEELSNFQCEKVSSLTLQRAPEIYVLPNEILQYGYELQVPEEKALFCEARFANSNKYIYPMEFIKVAKPVVTHVDDSRKICRGFSEDFAKAFPTVLGIDIKAEKSLSNPLKRQATSDFQECSKINRVSEPKHSKQAKCRQARIDDFLKPARKRAMNGKADCFIDNNPMIVGSTSNNSDTTYQNAAKKFLTKSILKNSQTVQNISPKIIAIRSKLLHEPTSPSTVNPESAAPFMNNIITGQGNDFRSRLFKTREINSELNKEEAKPYPNANGIFRNLRRNSNFVRLKFFQDT